MQITSTCEPYFENCEPYFAEQHPSGCAVILICGCQTRNHPVAAESHVYLLKNSQDVFVAEHVLCATALSWLYKGVMPSTKHDSRREGCKDRLTMRSVPSTGACAARPIHIADLTHPPRRSSSCVPPLLQSTPWPPWHWMYPDLHSTGESTDLSQVPK